jgi:guanylate kinase
MSSDPGGQRPGTAGQKSEAEGQTTQASGILFVVSAPSGTGKTTLVERLVQVVPDLTMSRSYTSRPSREGETDGVDYNFISRPRFEQMARAGEFLEWADVFGNLYGTSAADTARCLERGCDLVLVIDVQGARQVRRRRAGTVGVFVLPPSFEVLARRLRGRSKDSEDAVERRLQTARGEVTAYSEYDYVVVNDEFDACVERLRGIVLAERARLGAMREKAKGILETFQ